jgi:RNA polymerase-binding transcription factor DksA
MDEIDVDLSSEREQLLLDARIRDIRAQVGGIPENNSGHCWTCGEPVPDKRRWCSADCRDIMESLCDT